MPRNPSSGRSRVLTTLLRNKLIQLRVDQGLTQRELAAKGNGVLHQATLSEVERGVYDPLLSTLAAWADALDCDLIIDVRPRRQPPREATP